ncbi:MAG TPA: endonuclease/exonuclease/phosphatase family protein [Thermoanaerobaculia bacterium]|nr:endonuclease/exonuclease/phosphatase family protein [Thermoanaerobaculia bacterium]
MWTAVAVVLLVASHAGASEVDFLGKGSPAHIRVMSQNAGSNSIFPSQEQPPDGIEPRSDRFARVLRAVAPDVLCIQEVFPPRNAAAVAELLDQVLPLDEARWQAHGHSDNVIASRFPLRPLAGYEAVHGTRGPRGHAVAIVELPEGTGTRELAVVCTHMDSRGQSGARLKHTAALLDSIAAVRSEAGRPVLLMGDLNAYEDDNAPHVAAMLAWAVDGQIVLRDAEPRVNASGTETWTFKVVGSPYRPAALDRVLYTPKSLERVHGFVLDTTSLPEEALETVGLRPPDVMRDLQRGHDHLPVVIDFAFRR